VTVEKLRKRCEIGSELIEELTSLNLFAKILDMSITFHKKKKKRQRTHGFLKRQKTVGGKRTLKRRRKKGRWSLTV